MIIYFYALEDMGSTLPTHRQPLEIQIFRSAVYGNRCLKGSLRITEKALERYRPSDLGEGHVGIKEFSLISDT